MRSCDSCPSSGGASRREFLKISTSGSLVVLAAAALGLAESAPAAALPLSYVESTGAGNEKRYPIPQADGASIDRSAQVILVRLRGKMMAFALSCPHENAAVKWLPKDGRFQCTKHDSQYTPEGVHTSGRATRNMDRYAIRKEETSVVVDLNHWYRSDQDPNGWNGAAVSI